jgi:hypothetical protein
MHTLFWPENCEHEDPEASETFVRTSRKMRCHNQEDHYLNDVNFFNLVEKYTLVSGSAKLVGCCRCFGGTYCLHRPLFRWSLRHPFATLATTPKFYHDENSNLIDLEAWAIFQFINHPAFIFPICLTNPPISPLGGNMNSS